MPVPSRSAANVVVIADEAHRSQYGSLAANIRPALPNATRIGFTGTPIERPTARRRSTFGDYISVYRMARAPGRRGDGADLLREPQVPLARRRASSSRRSRRSSRPRTTRRPASCNRSWARLEKRRRRARPLDTVADDIVEHFAERCEETLPGKAMVVAYSRRIAAELTERLQERLGEEAVDVRHHRLGRRRPADLQVPTLRRRSCARSRTTSRTPTRRCGWSSSATCG